MVINFFQPQPIKSKTSLLRFSKLEDRTRINIWADAQIYYPRRIMHNWQDRWCRIILSNITATMAPDSRLLIGEMVVLETNAGVDKTVYWMDLCMLIIGGKERSEKKFSSLVDSAGLKLVKIWRSKVGSQTVIEYRLKWEKRNMYIDTMPNPIKWAFFPTSCLRIKDITIEIRVIKDGWSHWTGELNHVERRRS